MGISIFRVISSSLYRTSVMHVRYSTCEQNSVENMRFSNHIDCLTDWLDYSAMSILVQSVNGIRFHISISINTNISYKVSQWCTSLWSSFTNIYHHDKNYNIFSFLLPAFGWNRLSSQRCGVRWISAPSHCLLGTARIVVLYWLPFLQAFVEWNGCFGEWKTWRRAADIGNYLYWLQT